MYRNYSEENESQPKKKKGGFVKKAVIAGATGAAGYMGVKKARKVLKKAKKSVRTQTRKQAYKGSDTEKANNARQSLIRKKKGDKAGNTDSKVYDKAYKRVNNKHEEAKRKRKQQYNYSEVESQTMKYVNIANFSEEEQQPKKKKRGLVKKAIVAGAAGAAAYGGYKNRKKIKKNVKRVARAAKKGYKDPSYADRFAKKKRGMEQARKKRQNNENRQKSSGPRQINID